MPIFEEYKRSLKMPEAEEILDLWVYRPAAYLVVKSIYRSPVTPNQVTVLSLLAGLTSSWFFSRGNPSALVWAAFWYAVANVLDCSDGQLARLQQSGTPLGRLVDGIADYLTSVAIFLGIGIGLGSSGDNTWILVILAGISSALHAAAFDHYQSEFISFPRNEKRFHDEEVQRISAMTRRPDDQTRNNVRQFFLTVYLGYLRIQHTLVASQGAVEPERYRANNLRMIRLWSFLGPTTNRTALMICAIAGRIDLCLWAVTLPGNFWLMVCLVMQRNINRKMRERPT